MYKAMLEGCSVEVSARILTSDALGERDALAAYDEASMKVTLAFQAPGALERICHHPMGDFTGEQPLGARIADDLIHSRDLARAIGDDESLDDDLVRVAWQVVEPLLPILGVDAGFKDGPSGRVDDDAPLRLRPLDSVGRRP
jgi:uncharacterized protein (TIGR03086 family)